MTARDKAAATLIAGAWLGGMALGVAWGEGPAAMLLSVALVFSALFAAIIILIWVP